MSLALPTTILITPQAGAKLGQTMNAVRSWLDEKKIQPLDFKSVALPEGFGFELRFSNEDDAEACRHEFA